MSTLSWRQLSDNYFASEKVDDVWYSVHLGWLTQRWVLSIHNYDGVDIISSGHLEHLDAARDADRHFEERVRDKAKVQNQRLTAWAKYMRENDPPM